MALGIMLSVLFVLAATLTLLPAVLAKLGPKVDALALKWVHSGEHRSARFERWGERPWRHPSRYVVRRGRHPRPARAPRRRARDRDAVDQQCSRRRRLTRRLRTVSRRLSGSARPGRCRSSCPSVRALPRPPSPTATPASPASRQARRKEAVSPIQAVPERGPSSSAVGDTIERLRAALPDGAPVGGAAAENHDLEQALGAKTPLVIGVVLVLGFLLLLVALQALLIAALGVATNLLATAAAFGVARLVFQDGHGAGLLGFESQGFLDAWGPVFFAMIFAISMDYTVFLLSSAKEHYDRDRRPARSDDRRSRPLGAGDLAAAAVMVAVFFTFALSGPLPPKEMGVILGIAVLDATLVRLVLVPVLLRVWPVRPGRSPAGSTASSPTSASGTCEGRLGPTPLVLGQFPQSGRTSIVPTRATGCPAAISTASSRLSHSMMSNPPTASFVSANGPSVTIAFPSRDANGAGPARRGQLITRDPDAPGLDVVQPGEALLVPRVGRIGSVWAFICSVPQQASSRYFIVAPLLVRCRACSGTTDAPQCTTSRHRSGRSPIADAAVDSRQVRETCRPKASGCVASATRLAADPPDSVSEIDRSVREATFVNSSSPRRAPSGRDCLPPPTTTGEEQVALADKAGLNAWAASSGPPTARSRPAAAFSCRTASTSKSRSICVLAVETDSSVRVLEQLWTSSVLLDHVQVGAVLALQRRHRFGDVAREQRRALPHEGSVTSSTRHTSASCSEARR